MAITQVPPVTRSVVVKSFGLYRQCAGDGEFARIGDRPPAHCRYNHLHEAAATDLWGLVFRVLGTLPLFGSSAE
jgi:hypothetical protein